MDCTMAVSLTGRSQPKGCRLREDVTLRIAAWGYFFVFLKLCSYISAHYGEPASNVFTLATLFALAGVVWPALFAASLADFDSRLNKRLTIGGIVLYVPAVALAVTAMCIHFGLV
jgi:hypothetical protein